MCWGGCSTPRSTWTTASAHSTTSTATAFPHPTSSITSSERGPSPPLSQVDDGHKFAFSLVPLPLSSVFNYYLGMKTLFLFPLFMKDLEYEIPVPYWKSSPFIIWVWNHLFLVSMTYSFLHHAGMQPPLLPNAPSLTPFPQRLLLFYFIYFYPFSSSTFFVFACHAAPLILVR